ncbi:MAG: tetratricopeptide repeat protein [Kiritimatiellae bacterium]|nr:tetratricopeptide repeat protein [Kiritimatiellia bacterium]
MQSEVEHRTWRIPTPWLAVAALVTLAFSLACRLTSETADAALAEQSIGARFLGSGLQAISETCYEAADRYFHKGVDRFRPKAFDDPIQHLTDDIRPARHAHVAGIAVKEIMAWLRFAIWADPRNVEPYLVTAYWLAGEAQEPEKAERVLLEGLAAVPTDYQIRLELGRLYLKTERLAQAERALEQALRLWPSGADPQDLDARKDKVQILLYRALLHEIAGRTADAAGDFSQALDIFPDRPNIRARLYELQNGIKPKVTPRAIWQSMLLSRRHVCDYEGHDHGHDEHEHGDGAHPHRE